MPISVGKPPSFPNIAAPAAALVRLALALELRRAGEIAIVLTDDAALRALNRRWRGLDRATDVLSFGYDAGAPSLVEGDLVISLDRLREQARRYRTPLGRELARLLVHGALHLAGLDHHRVSERRVMRSRERAALRDGAMAVAKLERALAGWPSAPKRMASKGRAGR